MVSMLSIKTKMNKFIIPLLLFLMSCNSNNDRIDLHYLSVSEQDSVIFFDSVSTNIHLVEIRKYSSLGDFQGKYCLRVNDSIFYEVVSKKNLYLRYSNDFIYFSKYPRENEYGWVNVVNNNFFDLPKKDSIKNIIAKKYPVYRFEKNGRIFLYNSEGVIVKEQNYADFLFKDNDLHLETLSIGTYSLEKRDLKKVSNNVNEVLEGELEGVYFVTFPGISCYSIRRKGYISDYLNEKISVGHFSKNISIP